MKKIIFTAKGNEHLGEKICADPSNVKGEFEQRKFPDGETYIRLLTEVKNEIIVIVCSLNNPDEKLFPLILFAETLHEMGAKKVILVSPYLPYMRQDKRFLEGEAVSNKIFAKLVSQHFDHIITVDPHLHRIDKLAEIFDIPSSTLKAANTIGKYIRKHYPGVFLIGPDSESEQWVKQVSAVSGAPYIILEKNRLGDREVKIQLPDLNEFKSLRPVLLDDIISSARTMMEIISHLNRNSMQKPVCIGIHAVFSLNAYEDLISQSIEEVITCNTIQHFTNKIDLSELFLEELRTIES